MQGVAVDSPKAQVEGGLVRLGDAIKKELGSRPQRWLAEQLGTEPSTVTRIIKGQMREVSVERVREIEDVLGVQRGAILRRAGYVAETTSPEAALAADLSIPPQMRAVLSNAITDARKIARRG